MKVVFFLKGAVRIDWRVPDPKGFNFQIMVKMIRADGQFLAEGLYIQSSEIAAIMLDRGSPEDDYDEDKDPNVGVHHKGKVERLMS